MLETIDALIAHGETLARLELEKLPKGTFEAVDYIDDDGLGGRPVRDPREGHDHRRRVHLRLHRLAPAGPRAGEQHLHRPALRGAGGLQGGHEPAARRPTTAPSRRCAVICPPGTILSCERPAPCSIYWEALTFGAELIWRALAPHLPDRLGAGHMASVVGTIVAGPHADTGDFVVLVEPEVGGWGANPSADGNVGQFCAWTARPS